MSRSNTNESNCYICLESSNDLWAQKCACKSEDGNWMWHVHPDCLEQWCMYQNDTLCNACKQPIQNISTGDSNSIIENLYQAWFRTTVYKAIASEPGSSCTTTTCVSPATTSAMIGSYVFTRWTILWTVLCWISTRFIASIGHGVPYSIVIGGLGLPFIVWPEYALSFLVWAMTGTKGTVSTMRTLYITCVYALSQLNGDTNSEILSPVIQDLLESMRTTTSDAQSSLFDRMLDRYKNISVVHYWKLEISSSEGNPSDHINAIAALETYKAKLYAPDSCPRGFERFHLDTQTFADAFLTTVLLHVYECSDRYDCIANNKGPHDSRIGWATVRLCVLTLVLGSIWMRVVELFLRNSVLDNHAVGIHSVIVMWISLWELRGVCSSFHEKLYHCIRTSSIGRYEEWLCGIICFLCWIKWADTTVSMSMVVKTCIWYCLMLLIVTKTPQQYNKRTDIAYLRFTISLALSLLCLQEHCFFMERMYIFVITHRLIYWLLCAHPATHWGYIIGDLCPRLVFSMTILVELYFAYMTTTTTTRNTFPSTIETLSIPGVYLIILLWMTMRAFPRIVSLLDDEMLTYERRTSYNEFFESFMVFGMSYILITICFTGFEWNPFSIFNVYTIAMYYMIEFDDRPISQVIVIAITYMIIKRLSILSWAALDCTMKRVIEWIDPMSVVFSQHVGLFELSKYLWWFSGFRLLCMGITKDNESVVTKLIVQQPEIANCIISIVLFDLHRIGSLTALMILTGLSTTVILLGNAAVWDYIIALTQQEVIQKTSPTFRMNP